MWRRQLSGRDGAGLSEPRASSRAGLAPMRGRRRAAGACPGPAQPRFRRRCARRRAEDRSVLREQGLVNCACQKTAARRARQAGTSDPNCKARSRSRMRSGMARPQMGVTGNRVGLIARHVSVSLIARHVSVSMEGWRRRGAEARLRGGRRAPGAARPRGIPAQAGRGSVKVGVRRRRRGGNTSR